MKQIFYNGGGGGRMGDSSQGNIRDPQLLMPYFVFHFIDAEMGQLSEITNEVTSEQINDRAETRLQSPIFPF